MESDVDIELRSLLEAIYARYRHDFRRYAAAPLRRRLRQALPRFEVQTLSGLQDRVLHDPGAFHDLLPHLTVQVSEMFRDPGFFRALREKVVPALRAHPSLKVWVPGCSTGEEVYSIAIVFREEGLLDRTLVYATDISPAALEKAERGIYPEDRVAGFSRAYRAAGGKGSLLDHCTLAYHRAKFDVSLTRRVVFSDHSLATDGVFAQVQLVSCRNVLIYFDAELQDRAVGLFEDSLERDGFLALGASETVRFTTHAGAFTDFVREHRIYRKRSGGEER